MKKLLLMGSIGLFLLSCADSNEEVNEEILDDQAENNEYYPLLNMYGEDSLDAEGNVVYAEFEMMYDDADEEELNYTLGPDTDVPFVNIYGEDSTDASGNFVYPPRDTIFH